MFLVLLFALVILLLDYLYYKFYLSNWKTRLGNSVGIQNINFNIANEEELKVKMTQFLNERVKMLDSMSYEEWVDYNNKNVLFSFNDKKYYLFIYEKNNDVDNPNVPSNFVLRASYQKEFINLDFKDEVRQVNKRYIVLQQLPTNDNLIDLMYYMDPIINHCNIIDYYWEDPFNQRAVQKSAYVHRFDKKQNDINISGVMGIGYQVADLDYNFSEVYINQVGLPFFLFVFSFLFLLTCLLFYSEDHSKKYYFIKPFVFLIVTNLFLVYQLSLFGTITNLELEQNRVNEITTSTLGVSFLVAVNIFIIQNIAKKKGKLGNELYKENIFIFCFSLIFLLFSMYKQTNYTEVNGLRNRRIQNQIFFNLSVLLNFTIFANYLFFSTNRSNIFAFKNI